MNKTELIEKWSQFWTSKKHFKIENKSIINKEGSLLFVNSGVSALRPYFLGEKTPPHSRLFNVQDVIRTNDISLIGKTNRHLTFFRMLGNFSFNDYQKKESLTWALEFLTSPKWLNLDIQKLYITYLFSDDETKQILLNIGVEEDHLISGDKTTNFWDLGVGPCGTNVEFFYDLGQQLDKENKGIELLKENIDNDRYLEIWNVVFSYMINDGEGNYTMSNKKNIDTGAGLERLLIVVNNFKTPFQLKEYTDIADKIEKKTTNDINVKIICDHVLAIKYCLKDLIKEKYIDFKKRHGSVVRHLIRNASMRGYFLNYRGPFLFKLFEKEYDTIVMKEEKVFWKIMTTKTVSDLLNIQKGYVLKGEKIFDLVTSKGVPLLLIKLISKKNSFKLDMIKFKKLWEKHLIISKGGKEK